MYRNGSQTRLCSGPAEASAISEVPPPFSPTKKRTEEKCDFSILVTPKSLHFRTPHIFPPIFRESRTKKAKKAFKVPVGLSYVRRPRGTTRPRRRRTTERRRRRHFYPLLFLCIFLSNSPVLRVLAAPPSRVPVLLSLLRRRRRILS